MNTNTGLKRLSAYTSFRTHSVSWQIKNAFLPVSNAFRLIHPSGPILAYYKAWRARRKSQTPFGLYILQDSVLFLSLSVKGKIGLFGGRLISASFFLPMFSLFFILFSLLLILIQSVIHFGGRRLFFIFFVCLRIFSRQINQYRPRPYYYSRTFYFFDAGFAYGIGYQSIFLRMDIVVDLFPKHVEIGFAEVAFKNALFNTDTVVLTNLCYFTQSFGIGYVVSYQSEHILELLFTGDPGCFCDPNLVATVFIQSAVRFIFLILYVLHKH